MSDFLPLNIKTFLETVRGNVNPLTERNLSDEEKETLKRIIQRKQQQNLDREFSMQNLLLDTPQEYRRGPDHKFVPESPGSSRMVSVDVPYTERQALLQKGVDSFKNTRGRTSVSYGDYGIKSGEEAAPVGQGWTSAIQQSLDDPAFRLAATLGSFKAYDTPTGYDVQDKYKFNKEQQWFYHNAEKDSLPAIVKRYYDQPGSLGEILFRKYLGDRSRPVSIKLDK